MDQGVCCYTVMSFGLKNVEMTYQCLVNTILRTLMGQTIEVYVDDMLTKSLKVEDRVCNLIKTFDLRKYNMKLNLTKCFFFGISSGKFLGFIVTKSGIHTNPKKIKAIIEIRSPQSVKEVQKLTRKIASSNCFLLYASNCCVDFFYFLKVVDHFQWMEERKAILSHLKDRLQKLSTLAKVEVGDLFYMYYLVSKRVVSVVLLKECVDGI